MRASQVIVSVGRTRGSRRWDVGMTCNTTCLKCAKCAPEVGDFGHIGYPSCSQERGPSDRLANFGYIYDGFEAINLVTYQLDSLREFLLAHKGHPLHTFADGEPAFGDGDGDVEDPAGDEEVEDPEENWTEETAQAYPVCFFRLECPSCKASVQSEFAENIKRFETAPLSSSAIDLFMTHVIKEDEAFYRSHPLSREDLEKVAAFLKKHKAHSPVASAVPEEG